MITPDRLPGGLVLNDQEMSGRTQYKGPCAECQAGIFCLQYLTYFTWLNGELITVSNFPAWVCDVCGRREYDARAITWLNTLLNPETGRNAQARRKSDFPGAGQARP
jgi:YgiT-type zinc finger domain-containing protein